MITFENIQQLEKYTLMTMHGLFNQLNSALFQSKTQSIRSYTYMMETLFPRRERQHCRFNS